ncbi:polycomb group protein Psc-like [Ochlerotatus camptorhynchus]|uniref:polycomb group protein Psc-like n=1 Tax=Ochlerotatus camptorhynchus TaxID=644619 RepID=UPI0031DF3B0F
MVLQPAAARKHNTEMAGEVTKAAKTMTTVVNGPESPYKPSKVLLSSVNPYITCNLCKGYLIDATTIVECLHSFCHSCIMKHLRTEQYCPQCEMMINKAKPNIKPDATLQSIVYKLVPGLYEKELLRKRAFYRQHPEKAALTTPEQRGEDTEHLIFSPSDKFSLTLEYADKELADENEELLKPKVLKCPAVFTIAYLKKFIIYKYNIPTHLFYVEIMYKVQTITLPDHYTLMDVAYIYTWKKDAHMRFFYRIRTHEMKSVELPEVPLRRSPSISTGRTSTSLTTIKEEEPDSKENSDLIKPSDIKREEPSVVECDNKVNSDSTTPTTTVATAPSVPNKTTSPSTTTVAMVTTSASNARSGVSEPTLDVKSNVSALGGRHQQQQVESVEQPKVKKNESIKLKIEMNKNTYVSILQSPQPDAGSKHHKSDKGEKVKKKKSEDKDKSVNKIKSSSDLKIKIEKVKDGLVSVKKDGKSSKKAPYKVELSGLSDVKNNNHKSADNEYESKKAKKEAKMLDKCAKKMKSPKRNLDLEKVQPSIVLKIDQKSPELSTSTLKMVSHPLASSSPKHKAEATLEDEKSQFLNSFELTPIKSIHNKSGSPMSSPESNSSSPPSSSSGDMKLGKRKNKDAPAGRSVLKKPKLSDDEMKALVERTVQQTKFTSEHMASLTTPAKTAKKHLENPPVAVPVSVPSQPLPVKSETSAKEVPKSEQKSKTTGFKAPSVLPPPVVSANNIPAPKPTQPVMIAPKPVAEAPKRPSVPSFPKPIQPMKKLPPLLPKDPDYIKNNKQKLMEMKRPQQSSAVNLNISPNKDTEISQIKPEDAKKNIKVYGPPSDNDNFAVPAAVPSLSKTKTNKNRPVNFLNYALHNTNKAPAGSRTPIPSYSSSPSYSPDSPQYNPNFNISTKQYKYTNPLAYANFVQNMLNDRKSSNVSPPSVPEKKPEQSNERKRPCPSPEIKQEPPEKQPKVQSLLNQINIPSSLSITLATEEDEAAREKARKSLPEEDKNYIEILKLPEISITEADRTTPPKAQETAQKKSAKCPSPSKSDSLLAQKASELDKSSFQDSFIQSIKGKVEKQRPNKSGNKPEKQPAPVFTPPTPVPNNNAFKLPNATVLSNGIVKLNSYPELDLINKNSASQSPRPLPSPPKTTTSKHIPIAPKPTGTFFPPTGTPPVPSPAHRKSMSPPVPKPSISPMQPKSKTPPIVSSSSPSHATLASMGPMFGLQMKPEGSGFHHPKKSEPRPKKSSQKSPKSSALDLTATPAPMVDKTKETMNMLMMNNNISNAQKYQMANYLNGMMVPPMGGNPILNQMMAASFYLQQWNRMTQAKTDSLEK